MYRTRLFANPVSELSRLGRRLPTFEGGLARVAYRSAKFQSRRLPTFEGGARPSCWTAGILLDRGHLARNCLQQQPAWKNQALLAPAICVLTLLACFTFVPLRPRWSRSEWIMQVGVHVWTIPTQLLTQLVWVSYEVSA